MKCIQKLNKQSKVYSGTLKGRSHGYNIHKVVRWSGEKKKKKKSVGYANGIRGNNHKPRWNDEIKQKRKVIKEISRTRRHLEMKREREEGMTEVRSE